MTVIAVKHSLLGAHIWYQQTYKGHYSRKIHARMVDGKAYGFAFDDGGGFESLVHDCNPAMAYTTLTAF